MLFGSDVGSTPILKSRLYEKEIFPQIKRFRQTTEPISKNGAYASLGEKSRTGRKPKKFKSLDERLAQVEKECESFARLIRGCWCNPGSQLIKVAAGATEIEDVVDRYDDALIEMQTVKRLAEVGTEILLEGRKEAIRKRTEVTKKSSKPRKKKR